MMQVIVIHSEHRIRQLLYQVLSEVGYEVILWEAVPANLDPSKFREPTLFIGACQPAHDGSDLEWWQLLPASPPAAPSFGLMLVPENHFGDCAKVLEQGVDDWLSQPINVEELKARVLAGKQVLMLKQELQVQKQLLETELAEAEAYVRSLLPHDLTEKVTINARFIPSRLLGGDSYDYYWLDPDYLVMYLLDVSGHGLGSALLSTSVLNMLRSQSLPDVNFYRPEKVLKALNDTFQMNDQNEKYFTIWYGVYNRANRQLLYASAGHPPAVLISSQGYRSQTMTCLKTSGLPIGMMPDIQYSWQRCYIPPASRLYLFSDGVYEIQQKNDVMMGLDEFLEILSRHTPDRTIDDILREVHTRTQSRIHSDDLSLLEVLLD
jgi:sigma-B regulation protein RsbU (phosphoserine phosphatase)